MSNKDIWRAYVSKNILPGTPECTEKHITELYDRVRNEQTGEIDEDKRATDTCKRCHGSGKEPQDGWDGLNRNKLVNKWMANVGFKSSTVMMSIVGYLESSGCDWDLVEAFVNNSNKPSLLDIVNTMRPPEGGRIMPMLVDIIRENLQLEEQLATRLYYSLFNLPFAESTVSVGKGELVMALFTDAEKGSVGDIMIAGGKAVEQDEDGVITKNDQGLQTGGVQIEVKVGKARVISARGGKFLEPNMDVERVYAARKQNDGSITSTPHRTDKPGFQGISKNEFDRSQGHSQYYQTEGQHLTNEEFVNHLFGDQHANPGFNAFDRVDKVCSSQMLAILNSIDSQAGFDTTPKYELRDQLISTSIVWSYANPPGGSGHGFDYLLAILSTGHEGKSEKDAIQWSDRNLKTHGDYAKKSAGGKMIWDPRIGTGDKDRGIAIPCKGEEGFRQIYQAIASGTLTVSRASSTGKLDGEGMYMYYKGSDTNVGHEPGVGVDLLGDRSA